MAWWSRWRDVIIPLFCLSYSQFNSIWLSYVYNTFTYVKFWKSLKVKLIDTSKMTFLHLLNYNHVNKVFFKLRNEYSITLDAPMPKGTGSAGIS